MADPDAEQHAARRLAGELGMSGRDLARLVLPHVEDPGGDGDPLGRVEQRPEGKQVGRATQPERPKAEVLDQLGRDAGVVFTDRAVRGLDSDFAELHHG